MTRVFVNLRWQKSIHRSKSDTSRHTLCMGCRLIEETSICDMRSHPYLVLNNPPQRRITWHLQAILRTHTTHFVTKYNTSQHQHQFLYRYPCPHNNDGQPAPLRSFTFISTTTMFGDPVTLTKIKPTTITKIVLPPSRITLPKKCPDRSLVSTPTNLCLNGLDDVRKSDLLVRT